MEFFNNTLYNLTLTGALTFTGALAMGYEPIRDGAKQASVDIRDLSGKHARVAVSLSGTTFTIVDVFSSTESDNSLPAFGAGIQLISTNNAEVMERPFCVAVVNRTGQSNDVSLNRGKASLDSLFAREADNRVTMSNFHQDPRSEYSSPFYTEPAFHPVPSIAGADTFSSSMPFAFELLKEGWQGVHYCTNSANAVSMDYYANGATGYINTRDSLIEALNEDPRRRLVCWIHHHGESNVNTAPETYRDMVIAFLDGILAEVQAATGLYLMDTPVLIPGLHQDFVDSGAYNAGVDVRQGQIDIENFRRKTKYIALGSGLSLNADSANENNSTDTTHISAKGQFHIGKVLLPDALPLARMNLNPSGLSTILNISAGSPNLSLNGSNSWLYTSEALDVNASAPNLSLNGSNASLATGTVLEMSAGAPSLSLSGSTPSLYLKARINLAAGAPNLTMSGNMADLVTTESGPSIANTLAFGFQGIFRADYGVQTSDGTTVTQVDNLSGNNEHLTVDAGTVTVSGNRLHFDGSSHLKNNNGFLDTSNRVATVIFIQKGTAGEPYQEGVGGYRSGVKENNQYTLKPGFAKNEETINSPSIRDNTERVVVKTLDNSLFRVYIGDDATGISATPNHEEASQDQIATTGVCYWGAGNDGAIGWNGEARALLILDGVALTSAQANTVIAEFQF